MKIISKNETLESEFSGMQLSWDILTEHVDEYGLDWHVKLHLKWRQKWGGQELMKADVGIQ